MSHPSIPELLAALETAVEPDPRFAAAMRGRVFRELRGDATTPDSHWSGRTDESSEVTEVTLLDDERGARSGASEPASRRRWPLLAAAAAVALLVAVGLLSRSESGSVDTGPADTPSERPESGQGLNTTATTEAVEDADSGATFAGGQLDTFEGIEGEIPPYRVAAGDHVWVMSLDGTLTQRDRSTFEVVNTIKIPESSAIAADGGSLWVADAVDGEVLRIDAATGDVVATVPTGIGVDRNVFRPTGVGMLTGAARRFARIGGIVTEGGSVWVGDLDGRVLRIDSHSNTVVDEIDVSVRPHFVRVDGDHLLVGDFQTDTVAVIDTATGEEVLGVGPVGDLLGGDLHAGAAYIQDGDGGVVTRADLATGEERQSEPLGGAFDNQAIPMYTPGPVVTDAGVIAATQKTFHVLDEESLQLLDSFDLAGDVGEMTIGPEGEAWIVRFYTRTVVRLHAVES